MDLKSFRALVIQQFGTHLEHATPQNVREFLDHVQLGAMLGSRMSGRFVVEDEASTYEEVLKDFFAKVLEIPKDDAIILLWLFAFDSAFSAIELQQADKFGVLFHELDE